MERLTEKHYLAEDHYMKCSDTCHGDMDCIDCPAFDQLVERLAAYEDIAELCGGVDRLRELAEADKDGRVVVLPCKVGDTVYMIERIFDIDNGVCDEICARKVIGHGGNNLNKLWLVGSGGICNAYIFVSEFGKTVFLTREEAERAIQEMEGKKNGNETSM